MPKKQAAKSIPAASRTPVSPSPSTAIPWPSIPPPLPLKPLPAVTTLLPSQIFTFPLFSSSLSQQYLTCFQRFITPLLTTTPSKPKRGDAVRVNDRFQTWDETFAEMLWHKSGLKEIMQLYEEDGKSSEDIWGGQVVGLNPNIRVYRYLKGQFFDKHYDDSNSITLSLDSAKTSCHTTYTLLIYLTSSPPIVGGETVFYSPSTNKNKCVMDEIIVNPRHGMALLHAHGASCLLHEGKEVVDDAGGVGKWILRSDIVVRNK